MTLSPGQILQNRYRIVKLIGQGGYGTVYRAWDLSLNQPCALKENLNPGQEARQQFEWEAAVLAGLRHNNLPRVTNHFHLTGQGQYLVMDFVEGESLEKQLQARGQPFYEAELHAWIGQVCDALSYLHRLTRPIIHRDIKPANIIVGPDNQAFLVDFGIAKEFDVTDRTTDAAKAVSVGYSPPEQYTNTGTDARTDVYALGATLYELLTGQLPPDSLQLALKHDTLVPPRHLNQQISVEMEQVLLKAMALEKADRFQTVQALMVAYSAALSSPPIAPSLATQIAATPSQPATTGGSPAQSASSNRTSRWGLRGALVLLLISLIGGYLVLHRPGERIVCSAVAIRLEVQQAASGEVLPPSDGTIVVLEGREAVRIRAYDNAHSSDTLECSWETSLEGIQRESSCQIVYSPTDPITALVQVQAGYPSCEGNQQLENVRIVFP